MIEQKKKNLTFTRAYCCSRNQRHQKNFLAAASCWLLQLGQKPMGVFKSHTDMFDKSIPELLTCTWCSRRIRSSGWQQILQNEPWISRKAWEAAQGTLQPYLLDSASKKKRWIYYGTVIASHWYYEINSVMCTRNTTLTDYFLTRSCFRISKP